MARARPASMRAARKAAPGYGRPGEPDWREVDWSRHLNQAVIDGRKVNYCDYGSGPAALLVHGLGGSWQNWLENIRALGEQHRVIAPDLPGFGFSDMPPEDDIGIQSYALILTALCEQLGIETAAVVGNSMGGFIAAELAIRFPDLVESLVLVSAAGYSINDARRQPVIAWGRMNTAVATRTAAQTKPFVSRPRLRHLTFSSMVRHPSKVPQDTLFELAANSGRPGFMPALRAHMDYDFRDRVGDIACPTLIVWGSDDMIVTARDADEYERAIPGSRKVIYADTGHLPMVERAPEFNELVSGFLSQAREERGVVAA